MFIDVLKYGGVPTGGPRTAMKINSRFVVVAQQERSMVKIVFHDDEVLRVQHSNEDDARRLMGLFE